MVRKKPVPSEVALRQAEERFSFVGVMSPAISGFGGLLTNLGIAWLSYQMLAGAAEPVPAGAQVQPAV